MVLTRRGVLRGLSLSTLALGGFGLLSGCDGTSSPSRSAPRAGGVTRMSLVFSDVTREPGDIEAVPDAAASIHALGAGLYGELAKTPGNLALSPYSAAIALAMTLTGAKGETLDQMLETLDASDAGRLGAGLNALTRHVDSLAGSQQRVDGSQAEIELRTANALFGQQELEWQPEFLDSLAREYGVGMRIVDFKVATEAARTRINEWTAGQTRDRIPELVPAGVLDALTRLVLVNALYLKAPWENPFAVGTTVDEPFELADGATVLVPMMSPEFAGPSLLGSGEGWRATQLPYAGRQLAMTVMLPDPGRLTEVEDGLAAGGLPQILASMQPQPVALRLPKWAFRTQAPLSEALAALGMTLPFDDQEADFSGMTTQERLFVSAVLQEAFVAVDEEGTEAAAATAVAMQAESAGAGGTPFIVDRPFLFVVHDVQHGTPLFLGRVADPRSG